MELWHYLLSFLVAQEKGAFKILWFYILSNLGDHGLIKFKFGVQYFKSWSLLFVPNNGRQ